MKDVVKDSKKQQGRPVGLYFKITGILAAIFILFTVAGTYVSYPTQAHRDTNAKLSAFAEQALKEGPATKVTESKEYKDTFATPEARYMMKATAVSLVVQIILSISLAGATYRYLRKNLVSKTRRALGATVVTNVVASTIAYLVTLPIVSNLSGVAMPGVGTILSSVILSFVIGLLLTFIVVSIFERLYNRKHSFIVE